MFIKMIQRIKALREKCNDNRGFTMIELMIAVTIIAILSGVSITIYRNYINRARVEAAKTHIRQMKTILFWR